MPHHLKTELSQEQKDTILSLLEKKFKKCAIAKELHVAVYKVQREIEIINFKKKHKHG